MGRSVLMTAAQARRTIGEAVSTRITELFEADLAAMRKDGIVEAYARSYRGSALPGRNPRAVPPVPLTQVVIGKGRSDPGVVFTWKSEYGDAPYFQIYTPAGWMTQVVHTGFAVIDGLPVTAVLDWDGQHRPTQVLTVELTGYFDASLHGWRAWSRDVVRAVDWSDPHRPKLLTPAAAANA
ncbi:hypothetical protein ABZW30_13005 [Kitasatospora sp. NPDC004669]|uniref:hypothetical protein n=1 Tax=Kitasatospora sp. NPDC004669 TaxID=3154555 RepID=UPI0033AB1B16